MAGNKRFTSNHYLPVFYDLLRRIQIVGGEHAVLPQITNLSHERNLANAAAIALFAGAAAGADCF